MRRWELVEGGSAGFREAGGPASSAGFPDEDAFVLPEAWREHVLPRRRGGVPVSLPEWWPVVDAAAVAEAEDLHMTRPHRAIEQVLTAPGSDPGVVAAVRAYRAGTPDPVGLAVVTAMVRDWHDPDWAERSFAGWTVRFGLGLAVRAALVSLEVDTSHLQAPHGQRARVTVRDLDSPYAPDPGFDLRVLAAARRALAAAPEPEHAAVVAELAELRDTPVRRAATSFLLPERTEWVDECLAELSGHTAAVTRLLRALLLPALGSAGQARRWDAATRGVWLYWTPQLVATLADGVGPAAVPLVAEVLGHYGSEGDRVREYAEYVAEFPTDAAMGELVDRIASRAVRPVLLETVRRFPVRAVRVLSAAARRGGPAPAAAAVRHLLNGHVAVLRSRLPEILPTLDEESAAYVRGLEGRGIRCPRRRRSGCPRCWSTRRGRVGGPSASRGCWPSRRSARRSNCSGRRVSRRRSRPPSTAPGTTRRTSAGRRRCATPRRTAGPASAAGCWPSPRRS
ncbi:hypothetical protein [Kitasatospora cineracea]|uniref:hypothetical protein n=1 Tax=Kitasatospora cineracea TaxID=88074 RepID=UPI000F47BE6F|nr:hypothetical protein [Kitasatospora cineracea]